MLTGLFAALAFAIPSSILSSEGQTSQPLPNRLVGAYHTSKGHRANTIPVELSGINVDGENVTGVVSEFRTVAGTCVAENTPFAGTYKDGTLSIKSKPLASQKPDGERCGGMVLNANFSEGRATGTFGLGKDTGIAIEFAAK